MQPDSRSVIAMPVFRNFCAIAGLGIIMSYKSDIEIAREAKKRPIQEIGAKIGIGSDDLLP